MIGQELPSRRTVLMYAGGAAASGAALLIVGCGSRSRREQVRAAPPSVRHQDVEVLGALLDLEREAVAAYTASIPLLPGPAVKAGMQFLAHELAHGGELAGLIKDAGGKPLPPAPSYALGSPAGAAQVLELLQAIEQKQIAAYLQALPQVSPGPVRAALAAILANDAQHLSIVRGQLGHTPAPAALVNGRA
ncbi:MAG: ferritin-like domain-containing protein [Solirubrobacterales bacterium]|nr:ferritin-like domain-containing protein [Solirubrobacterales bacterium]